MGASFEIWFSSTDAARPAVSFKVREYLASFITDGILREKGLVVTGAWNVVLGMIFLAEGKVYESDKILFIKKDPAIIRSEMVKLYEIIIPLKLIRESDDLLFTTVQLMYEALTIFLTTTFKSIKRDEIDDLWMQVDLDYIFSIEFPAPFNEQKYVGDSND